MLDDLGAQHEVEGLTGQTSRFGGAGIVRAVVEGEVERLHGVAARFEQLAVRALVAPEIEGDRAVPRGRCFQDQLPYVVAQPTQAEVVILKERRIDPVLRK